MDFFSAGGFQQLFSDLDEQLDNVPTYYIDMNDAGSGYYQQLERSLVETYNNSSSSDDSSSKSSSYQYANLNTFSEQSKDTQTLTTLQTASGTDQLNQQLENCLDYLLPNNIYDAHILDSAEFRGATENCLIQEVAEWEAQFLDNYIEIPELIDFLPEKTPLCTDTCELFLQESSKNLRLFRKPHKTKKCKGPTPLDAISSLTMKGYPCTFGSCQKIYAKPAHLKAHLRRHLGEKPYICTWPECTWKFSRSDELARHRRSHSGVKPYKCDYCTKCFARSDHLAKHRKVHERRMLAASKAGCKAGGSAELPSSVFNVRPGRKRKNQIC